MFSIPGSGADRYATGECPPEPHDHKDQKNVFPWTINLKEYNPSRMIECFSCRYGRASSHQRNSVAPIARRMNTFTHILAREEQGELRNWIFCVMKARCWILILLLPGSNGAQFCFCCNNHKKNQESNYHPGYERFEYPPPVLLWINDIIQAKASW